MAKSSQREGVCLVSHIRMKKEIWFFRAGIRVQTRGSGEVASPLCVWLPISKMGFIIRLEVPISVPAESKAALYFIVYFARVKTRRQPPCS